MAKIKKDTSLRKAILQAAITGQLISDVDGTTETGKQLLDRIIEERNAKLLAEWKEALKKNPKAKKPSPVDASEISEDEIPFEIPENWCWCRLGDVGDFLRGSGIKREETRLEGYPCIRYGEMYTKYKTVIKETVSFVEKEIFDKCQKIKTNDIVMSLTGENEYDIALAAVYLGEKVVAMGGDMTRFRPCLINSLFYVYAINSPYGIECKSQLATGNIIVHISNDKLSSILIPLPPLAVQNAIVVKLEEVLPLVDAYENAVLQKEELKTALPEKVKKAILQEAIQGKLTEDWRKTVTIEETGKQLLDRIITERNAKALAEWEEKLKTNPKAKKPTPIVASEIEEDEIPFEIPESWCWCRLGDVCLVKGGKRIPAGCTLTEVDTGHKYIRVADMKNGSVNIDTVKYITDEIHDKIKAYKISKDDVYITVAGTIGDSGIIPAELDNANLTENADKLVLFNGINKYCLHFFISSSFFQEQISDAITKVGQPKLAIIRIQNFLIPLPPLAEQKKIVEILEQMLPLCDKLGG